MVPNGRKQMSSIMLQQHMVSISGQIQNNITGHSLWAGVNFILLCLQISTLQSQIHSQETDLLSQEEELSRAKADLGRLQQEENQLEQSLAAGKIQLETIIKSLKATQDEINQVGNRACVCMCVIKCQQRASLHCIIYFFISTQVSFWSPCTTRGTGTQHDACTVT